MGIDEAAIRIGITGAGGFIASHVVQTMLREGFRVRALVHYNAAGSIGNLAEVGRLGSAAGEAWTGSDRLEIVHGDVLDERCMREFVKGCDQIFHLAALIGIPYSYAAPSSYIQVNTTGTLNLLEACRDAKTERIVVTSTSEVYGTAREVPIREQHLLQAQSPYAASKVAADKLAESYHLSFDLPVTTLRPFNTYGPRQTARAVIPTILSQALSPGCERIELGSLDPVRDLTYVEDNARGYLALARAPLETIAGRLYNMGTGKGYSIREVAELALSVVGVDKPIVSTDSRARPKASEVGRLIADAARFGDETGWRPMIDLEEGLRLTADWVREHITEFRPQEFVV